MIGLDVGPYRILDKLGEGGMGEVYRARDTRLGRDVAIKVLPALFAEHPDRLARFEIEAKAVGQLNHPNVLTVYDVGTHDGTPYLVMELLEGSTLRERLTEGLPPPRKAIEWASQIALGLAAAHDKGIVHRDLKPENVFITRDGRVKILDFGLARVAASGSGSGADAATTMQATEPGMVLGTVGYMSPEQVRGQPADARSDLFAVGSTLYEMLTGTRAFQRESPAETMAAILKEEPPELADSGRNIPPAADRIVRRCLEKQPAERFQSARDLAFALEAIAGSTTSRTAAVDAIVEPRRTQPARAIVLAAIAAASLAGAGAIGYVAARSAAGSTGGTPGVRLRQLTFDGGNAMQPTLSPDGSLVAYVTGQSGNLDIYVQRIDGANPINLTKDSPFDDFQPAFSPDGKRIAYRSNRGNGGGSFGIFVMGATGESVRRVTDTGANPAWFPDGTALAYATEAVTAPFGRSDRSSLWRVDIASGTKTKVFDGDAVQPSVSPDGKRIAFWGLPAGTGRRAIYTIAATGGTPTVVLDDGNYNWCPRWSPDGRTIYFASTRQRPMGLWRIALDPSSGAPTGSPVQVAQGTEDYLGLSDLANGSLVFPSTSAIDVVERMPIDAAAARLGGAATPLFRSARDLSYVRPSPDGRLIAMTVNDTSEDLVVVRGDGTGETRLTNDAAHDRGASWTKDSDRIFFFSDRSGQYEVWTIRADGSGLTQVTRRPPGELLAEPIVAPDGRSLAVNGASSGIGIVDVSSGFEGRTPRWLSVPNAQRFYPTGWSPDGQSLFGNADAGTIVFNLSSKVAKAFPGVSALGMPDSRVLLAVARQHEPRLIAIDVATGARKPGDVLPGDLQEQVLSGDGRWLYGIARSTVAHLWLLTLDAPKRP